MSTWFAVVMDAASSLSVEKRETFLQRLAARLQHRGRFDDADVTDAIRGASPFRCRPSLRTGPPKYISIML